MTSNKNTYSLYQERLNRVVSYINNHLDEKLDIDTLAEIGNYSAYHFHRIISAYLNEPLGSYIVRRRMETSLILLQSTQTPIIEIANKVGYETSASFNKAFKKRYQISPASYRKTYKFKIAEDREELQTSAADHLQSLTPTVVKFPTKKVLYSRVFGNYSDTACKAWNTLSEFAQARNLFRKNTEYFGVSYDDPKITCRDKLQFDACITFDEPVEVNGAIGIQEISGGKYAVFLHKGSYQNLIFSFNYIFGKWLIESDHILRDHPCFEKYLTDIHKTKECDLRTEIYIPIQ